MLSEGLKSNSALTELNMESNGSRRKTSKQELALFHCYCVYNSVNDIRDEGASLFGEALKVNTTLISLNLICKKS